MGRSSCMPATCLQKPVANPLSVWGILPCLYFISKVSFEKGIENYNLFIEKKEIIMQSSYFKFSLVLLLKVSCSDSWKILVFNVCWEETKHVTERCTSRSFSWTNISFSLSFKPVSTCCLKSPVTGFLSENMNLYSEQSYRLSERRCFLCFPFAWISPPVRQWWQLRLHLLSAAGWQVWAKSSPKKK